MLRLSHVYAGYGNKDVLIDINYHFQAGCNYCLVGPNGSGKTTLLRAISDMIAHRGSILIGDRPVQHFRRRELAAQLALMSQTNSTYFPYTVYETVMLGRYQHLRRGFAGSPSAQDKAVIERCLASTDLLELRDRQLDCLSGGQRQRVFLAHTLAQEPKIILLDEPTNHLDIHNQLELIKYLRHWTADGQHMVIGVFHDLNLALQLSPHMLFLQQGHLVRSGSFFEVADREFLHRLYGMDICAYMEDSLAQWRKLEKRHVFCQEMESVYCME